MRMFIWMKISINFACLSMKFHNCLNTTPYCLQATILHTVFIHHYFMMKMISNIFYPLYPPKYGAGSHITPLPFYPNCFYMKNPVSSILCYFSHFVLQKKRNKNSDDIFSYMNKTKVILLCTFASIILFKITKVHTTYHILIFQT